MYVVCRLHRIYQCDSVQTVKPLLKDISQMQPPPLSGHHCSVPFGISDIDMCTYYPPKQGYLLIQDSLLWCQWCPYYRGSTAQGCLLWSQWCPHYRGSTVLDCVLWSQWCPHYRGSTAQDCVLRSQWCPHYRGSTVQDCLLWSQWCPYYRGSMHTNCATAHREY